MWEGGGWEWCEVVVWWVGYGSGVCGWWWVRRGRKGGGLKRKEKGKVKKSCMQVKVMVEIALNKLAKMIPAASSLPAWSPTAVLPGLDPA